MSDLAIKVEHLSKLYKIGARQERYKTLRDTLTDAFVVPFRHLSSAFGHQSSVTGHSSSVVRPRSSVVCNDTIWALKDVSFEVKHGEVVGIIGRNGAGKSTLLKILSRITEPTEGRAIINGRVGSLLEVGTGFHPELTGRENIYLNGAILGMRKQEIHRKFDEIVAFAEIEKFLETPVKHYSSGMYVRLAFAVAAHLEPEILLVDEVLAVGDAAFQKKCLGKMGDVAKEGRTVLFVSHNMGAIQRLCSRAILLERGSIRKFGETREIVSYYFSSSIEGKYDQKIGIRTPDTKPSAFFSSWFVSLDGQYQILSGNDVSINLETEFKRHIQNVYFGIALWSDDGTLVWAANSHDDGKSTETLAAGKYTVQFLLSHLILRPGTYWIEASINTAYGQLDRWQAYPYLEVLPSRPTLLPSTWHGIVNFDYVFQIHPHRLTSCVDSESSNE